MLNEFWTRFAMLREIKRLGADIAINTLFYREPYLGDAIMRATCARERIGRKSQHNPLAEKDIPAAFLLGDFFYTKLLPEDGQTIFDFTRNRTFLANLLPGIDLPSSTRIEAIPVSTPGIAGAFSILMPGASVAFREWPPERFARIAQHLHQSRGLRCVLLGTEADQIKGDAIAHAAPDVPMDNFCGRLTLSQMISLIQRSFIGVTNDSGGIHLFTALQRPGVAISCASAFGICHPYPHELSDQTVFVYPPAFYQLPFSYAKRKEAFGTSRAHYPITDVTSESVIGALESLLQSGHFHESLLDN